MEKKKILVIDDEIAILEMIQRILRERYDIQVSNNGEGIEHLVEKILPDAILLDCRMAKIDGLSLLKKIRNTKVGLFIPIFMVTALKEKSIKLAAIQAGVDDYITKPFDPEELIVRIESKIKRFEQIKNKNIDESKLQFGNLTIDDNIKTISVNSKEIKLTLIEYNLLITIAKNHGKLVSRGELIKTVWKQEDVIDRVLDAHIFSLRKKMDQSEFQIKTVYGGGYRFENQINNLKK